MDLRVVAPGRVNLIGDHTDYTGGLVFPMAIDRFTTVTGRREGQQVFLTSADEPAPVVLPLEVPEPHHVTPTWGRYVAGVVAEARPTTGFTGTVTTDIPIGAGLSSSAALEVAVALALGVTGSAAAVARLCQRAENRASGVPSGIMDQLTICAGVADHALLIDCGDLSVQPVLLPEHVAVVVLYVAHRTLVGSPYAERVAQCAAAEALIGPLRAADESMCDAIDDPVVRLRARHVTSENQRVRAFAAALTAGDMAEAGHLMVESHRSLAGQYHTSTPAMDAAVEELRTTPGVYGARMTGGGFGGCVVALTRPGALSAGWAVKAVDGARSTS
jgi:galactokinase